MTNAKQFGQALAQLGRERMGNALREKQKEKVRAVWKGILSRTPVLTGNTRANWNCSLHEPNFEVSDSTDTSERMDTVEAVLSLLDQAPMGAVVFIANGLLHTQFLEHGSSSKAPEGIVQITLEEVRGLPS